MRAFGLTTFSEGISCTLVNFKKDFAQAIKINGWDAKQVKQAHKIATKGNGDTKSGVTKRKEAE